MNLFQKLTLSDGYFQSRLYFVVIIARELTSLMFSE